MASSQPIANAKPKNEYSLIYVKRNTGAEADEYVTSIVRADSAFQAEEKGKIDVRVNWTGFKFLSATWIDETKLNGGEVIMCCHQ